MQILMSMSINVNFIKKYSKHFMIIDMAKKVDYHTGCQKSIAQLDIAKLFLKWTRLPR